jgi:hypothetical protein
MTGTNRERSRQPIQSDDIDWSAHHASLGPKLLWIAFALVAAAICVAVSVAYLEPAGCGPLC